MEVLMKRPVSFRLARVALPALAIAALLMVFPTTRDYVIATAHAATQKVLVVNRDNRPVPTTPAEELFQQLISVSMNNTATSASNTFTVPAGNRLVLENIGGKGAATSIRFVEVSQGGQSAYMPTILINLTGSWKWTGTTQTKVVFNPGTVTVVIRRSTAQSACTTCSSGNHITLTGYLIPN
jgi:hypothetical protein